MLHLLTTPSLPSFPANTKPHHHDHHSLTPNRSKAFPHPHRPLRCAGSGSGSGSVNVEVDTFTKRSGYLFELTASEADSLAEYNVSKISVIYKRKPLVLIRRLVQIGTTFGRWFGLRYLDQIMERSEQMFEVRAAELRKILVELGPDLIPPSYLDELSLLQDRISPFSTKVAFNTIEQELGLPIDELFSEISPEPIAAASLGQCLSSLK